MLFMTKLLKYLGKNKKGTELFELMELCNQSTNRENFLDSLIDIGWVKKEFPADTNPEQRYSTTKSGLRILDLRKV